ncbi:MAG: hypothetical protein FWF52_04750 [Candidatus Azobacteroides sp.]|nr:hypothetical protein [Candidatus Azobacteroides sp.]
MKRVVQILLLIVVILLAYMCIASILEGMKSVNEKQDIEILKHENTTPG